LLCDRLGAAALFDATIGREGSPQIAAGAGAKALTVAFAMLAGADAIDDCDRLRAGATGAVLAVEPVVRESLCI